MLEAVNQLTKQKHGKLQGISNFLKYKSYYHLEFFTGTALIA